MTDAPALAALRSSKLRRFAVTMAVFVVAGPPIGGLAVWLFLLAQGLSPGAPPTADVFGHFFFVMGMAYFSGFFFALVAGIVVAAAGILWGWHSILVPVAAAAVASVVVIAAMLFFSAPTSSLHEEPLKVIMVFFPICLIASVACWFITRNLVRSP